MAEKRSMTRSEVVAKTLLNEHADFLKEAVAMVAAKLMEALRRAASPMELGGLEPPTS